MRKIIVLLLITFLIVFGGCGKKKMDSDVTTTMQAVTTTTMETMPDAPEGEMTDALGDIEEINSDLDEFEMDDLDNIDW